MKRLLARSIITIASGYLLAQCGAVLLDWIHT
jgi:hypothetical protein